MVDLRRALAQSCNPYFECVGERLGYERVHHYAELLGLGNPSGINLDGEAAGRIPVAVRPSQVGHLSSHAAGHRHLRRPARRAPLRDRQRRDHLPAAGQRPRRASCPRERWRLPPGTVLGGLSDGFLSAVNEGSAVQRVRSGRDRGRQDRHLLGRGLVRVLRARRPPRSRGGGVRAAGAAATSPRRWPAGSTRTCTSRPPRRSPSAAGSNVTAPARSPRGWSRRRALDLALDRPVPGRTTSRRWRPGRPAEGSRHAAAIPRNSPSTYTEASDGLRSRRSVAASASSRSSSRMSSSRSPRPSSRRSSRAWLSSSRSRSSSRRSPGSPITSFRVRAGAALHDVVDLERLVHRHVDAELVRAVPVELER